MKVAKATVAKFEVGDIYMTRGAAELNQDDVFDAFVRHIDADWGDVCEDDWKENELSLTEGFRLLSSYFDRDGIKFWIITEADRSSTTILLPSEY